MLGSPPLRSTISDVVHLFPSPPSPLDPRRIEPVAANQLRTLRRDVLGELCEEVERIEHVDVFFEASHRPGAGAVMEETVVVSQEYSEYFVWKRTRPLNGSKWIFFGEIGGREMYSSRFVWASRSRILTELSMLNPECFQPRSLIAKSSASRSQPDSASPEDFHHSVQTAERDEEERSLVVKAALENDRVEVRIEPQHVAVGLVGDDHARHQRPTGGLRVELSHQPANQSRHGRKQSAIVSEERAQRFRHGENELAVRHVKKHLIGAMLGEQKRTLLAARWAEVEPDDASLTLSS